MSAQATPGPYECEPDFGLILAPYGETRRIVARTEGTDLEATAVLITRCLNSHDALVAALKVIEAKASMRPYRYPDMVLDVIAIEARTALKLAEVKP